MKVEVKGRQIELAPNSPPYLLKRIVADGFDIVLVFLLFLAFTALLMKTPLADSYNAHADRLRAIEAETAAALGDDAQAIGEALSGNAEYQDEGFAASLNSYLLKAAACLLAELPILLLIPMGNRKRSTPGKLMAGVMPFNEKRQSRATRAQIFYRFLFVLLLDSLALYLYTGILTFLLVPVLRLTEMLLSGKKHKTICDFVTGIKIIETLSYDGMN